MSTTTSTERVTCPGCGKSFKGERGLRSHQTAKFVTMSCKPLVESVEEIADVGVPAPLRFVDPAEEVAASITSPAEFSNAVHGILTGSSILSGAYHAVSDEDRVAAIAADLTTATSVGTMVGGETTYEEITADPAPRVFIDGVEVTGTEAAAEQAAIDAEPYSDARLEASLAEHFEECAKEIFTMGESEDATVANSPTFTNADREALIAAATIYTSIPEDVRTVLVKIDGRDKWAQRMSATDVQAITATSTSSTVVRITKHESGGETVVTDFSWEDGMRARVTEKFAI